MVKAPTLFKPIDLVSPLGVCLGSAALCIWGAAAAGSTSAKAVSIATGVVFLAGPVIWYLLRWSYIKHDFQTVHGLFVRLGKVNRPTKDHMERWTDELVNFWPTTELAKVYHFTGSDVAKAIDGVWVIFSDNDRFLVQRPGGVMGFVYGYARPNEIFIRNPPTVLGKPKDETATRLLFRHELSHVIVEKGTGIANETKHHRIFKDVKLGA